MILDVILVIIVSGNRILGNSAYFVLNKFQRIILVDKFAIVITYHRCIIHYNLP